MAEHRDAWIYSLTAEQLLDELRDRQLPIDGTVPTMRDRLLHYVHAQREVADSRVATECQGAGKEVASDSGIDGGLISGITQDLSMLDLGGERGQENSFVRRQVTVRSNSSATDPQTSTPARASHSFPCREGFNIASPTNGRNTRVTYTIPEESISSPFTLPMKSAQEQRANIPHAQAGTVPRTNVNKEPYYVDNGGERDEDCIEGGQAYLSSEKPVHSAWHNEMKSDRSARNNRHRGMTYIQNRSDTQYSLRGDGSYERESLNEHFDNFRENNYENRGSGGNQLLHGTARQNDRRGHVGFREPTDARNRDLGAPRPQSSRTEFSRHAYASPAARAIYEVLRKWNLRFSGERTEDLELFLTRVEQGRFLVYVTDGELLSCMPFFLAGIALHWYCNSVDGWETWSEFVDACRVRFGDPDYQFELRQEIHSRTQGLDEPVADYLTCIRTLLRRLSPPLTDEEQVSYAHSNMLQKLQLTIHRSEVVSLDHLERLAIQLEKGHRASRSYRPPPPPERALLPGLAYRDPRRNTRGTRLTTLNAMEAADENIIELPVDELYFTPSRSTAHPARVKQATSGNNPNGREKAGNKNKTRNHPSSTAGSTKYTQEPDTPGNPFYTPTRPTRNSAPCNKPRQPEEETVCWNCHDLKHRFRECPKPRGTFCYRCGEPDFTSRNCPKCQGNEKGGR